MANKNATKSRPHIVQLSMTEEDYLRFKELKLRREALEGRFVSLSSIALEGLRKMAAEVKP